MSAPPAGVLRFRWFSLGLVDGISEIDPAKREVRRIVRVLYAIPVSRRTQPLDGAAKVHLLSTPHMPGGGRQSLISVVELETGPGKRIELAQSSALGRHAAMTAVAEAVSKALRIPIEHRAGAGGVTGAAHTHAFHFPVRGLLIAVNVICVVMLALQLLVTGSGADAFRRFESVSGRVLSSELQQITERRTPRRSSVRTVRTWHAVLAYEYQAEGRRQVSSRLYLIDHPEYARLDADGPTAAYMLATYKPGQAVLVHRALGRPDIAYLETGWSVFGEILRGLLPGWALLNVFVVLAWWLPRLVARSRRSPP